MKYLFLLLLTTSMLSCTQSRITYKDLKGRWQTDCDGFTGFDISATDTNIIIMVLSNQVVISAAADTSKLGTDNSITLRLVEPTDLGRGGMMMNWNVYDHDKPIAILTVKSEQQVQMAWHGFYNKQSNTYEWSTEIDMVQETKDGANANITLHKCQ